MAITIVVAVVFTMLNIVFFLFAWSQTETLGEALRKVIQQYFAVVAKAIPVLKRHAEIIPRNLKPESTWASGYLERLIEGFRKASIEYHVVLDEPYASHWTVRDEILAVSSSLNYVKRHLDELSPALKDRYSVVLQDIISLLEMLPSTYKRSYDSLGYLKVEFKENGVMDSDIATPFYEKLMEIRVHLDEVRENAEEEAKAVKEAEGSAIKAFVPASAAPKAISKGTVMVPSVNTSTMSKKEREAYKRAMAKMADLPLIESERVKRILADSAEAQALAKEASSNDEVSFDGRTPEQMVTAILADNAERLNRTIAEAVGNSGAADRLRGAGGVHPRPHVIPSSDPGEWCGSERYT